MKKTLKETRRQGWLTLLALSVIAITVYIGFAPLFSLVGGGVAGAVIGSSFGAIFVIILTMYLLNKQTEIEQETKKSERVFDEKVRLYQQILDITRDILIDGNLSEEEVNRLPFPVIRLQMLGADETIAAFQKVFEKLNFIYAKEDDSNSISIDEADKDEVFQLLSNFAGVCRKDLGISDEDVSEQIKNATNQTIANSGKKQRDYSKYSFDGVELAKNKYVWSVISDFIKKNPAMSINEFEKVFDRTPPELEGKREDLWKTYDEAIELFKSKGEKHKRYYVADRGKDYLSDKDLVLTLKDEEICITNQWNLRQITCFVEMIKQKGIRHE